MLEGLQACGGAGSSMRELSVHWQGSPLECAWLGGLTALQQLELRALNLRLPEGIRRLHSLAAVDLRGSPVDWRAVQRLPPSLTRLRLVHDSSERPASCLPDGRPAGLPG